MLNAFEPVFAYSLYNKALKKFDTLKAGLNISYSDDYGLNMDIISDIDKKFIQVFTELFNEELYSIKQSVKTEVQESLSKNMIVFNEKISEFYIIKNKIEEQKNRLDKFKTQLETKLNEGQKWVEDSIETTKEAAKKTTEKAINDVKDAAIDSAKNKIKNLFN